jgi:uncharacterized membrane protein
MNLIKNKLILYSLILSFLGFVVATYLTIFHYKNVLPPCNLTGNCEKVLTSQFANIGPIPLALLGSLFYLTVMILCLLILTNYKKVLVDIFYAVSAFGFLVSIILVLIQINILHAFCQYCLLSEATSTGIMILCYLHYKERKKRISI